MSGVPGQKARAMNSDHRPPMFYRIAGRGPTRLLAALLLALSADQLTAAADSTAAATYRLPYDVDAIRAQQDHPPTKARACPPFIAPPRQLQHEPRYRRGDATASVVDPERAAAEIAATQPVRDFNRLITSAADYALRAPSQAAAQSACVIAHLDHWASGDAFLGKNSMQGEFEKKWGAITYSLAYLETRSAATDEQRARITAWLARLGRDVHAHYSVPPEDWRPGQDTRRNNHAYWAALSCAVVGMAVDEPGLFRWGMTRFINALSDIRSDGYLSLELERGARSLEYHAFALGPLLLMASIARANGIAIPPERLAALRRLADAVRTGLGDPTVFEKMTGVPQSIVTAKPSHWAWAELALNVWPDAALEARIEGARPYSHVWLGGNLTVRYHPRAR